MAAQPANSIVDDPVLRQVLDVLDDAVVLTKADGFEPGWCPTVVYVNAAFTRMTGFSARDVIGGPPSRWAPQSVNEEAHEHLRTALERGEPMRVRVRFRSKSGEERFGDAAVAPLDQHDGAHYFIEITRDVTGDRAGELRLQEAQEVAQLGSWEWLIPQGVVRCSDELYRLLGIDPDDFEATNASDIIEYVHPDDQAPVTRLIEQTLATSEPFESEFRIHLPDDTTRWIHTRGRLVIDSDGQPIRMLGTCQDMTERKTLEEELRRRVLLDPLTRLPNRLVLSDRLGHALAAAERHAGSVAVLHIDLDGFTAVNTTQGSTVGDQVLIEAGRRLQASLRRGDTVSRVSDDEFVAVCESIAEDGAARIIAHTVVDAIAAPFLVEGVELSLTACVGVAVARSDDAAEVLRRADAALYGAKASGPGSVFMHSGQ